jgi:hypothetical protein
MVNSDAAFGENDAEKTDRPQIEAVRTEREKPAQSVDGWPPSLRFLLR